MTAQPALLRLEGVTKRFGTVTANENVSFELREGNVIGLLGENGAGKTTLMNIVFGLYRPDAGAIFIKGEKCSFSTTADAIDRGVGMVHQHSNVVESHSVIENLMVGLPGRHGLLDRQAILLRLAEIEKAYGLALDPERLVGTLAVGQRQRLDIIRALVRRARVLILDEPTSVLTPPESEGLFAAIKALQADGVGLIFISHKLPEVRAISDRIVVLRHGKVMTDTSNDGTLSVEDMARLMCGQEPERIERTTTPIGPPRLTVQGLRLSSPGSILNRPEPLDLIVHQGEIVGIAGVSGNGQVELAETLAGMNAPLDGTIMIDGRAILSATPTGMRAAGLAYVPEDRIGVGLVGTLSLRENLMLTCTNHPRFSRRGWLRFGAIDTFARDLIRSYDVRPADPDMPIGLLSGGNQQKAIVARELAFKPTVLVIAQPTRGLDVSATSFVHREIMNLKQNGCALVLISDDLDEILQLSDRIAVMYGNSIVCNLPIERATVRDIGLAMTGASTAQTGQAA